MDCAGVAGVLVAYHLGSIADSERDEVEAHLLSCASCLRTYLALKRAADHAAGSLARPRPEVRERLRAEVMRTFATPKSEPRALRRRIPLYQGVALAAIAAAIALVAPSFLQWAGRNAGGRNAEPSSIDTNRTRAESLHIY